MFKIQDQKYFLFDYETSYSDDNYSYQYVVIDPNLFNEESIDKIKKIIYQNKDGIVKLLKKHIKTEETK